MYSLPAYAFIAQDQLHYILIIKTLPHYDTFAHGAILLGIIIIYRIRRIMERECWKGAIISHLSWAS
nr:hypothetical protein Q903MT_gene6033 [Picea sitchensis]